MRYLVVGAGLSGAVIAERLVETDTTAEVVVIDKRDHIGGNCQDYVDPETGILMNKQGAHLFHTNNERVWNYIKNFGEWERWEHEVVASVDGKQVPVPVNMTTVNMLAGASLQDEVEVREWLRENQIAPEHGGEPRNGEEMALSRVGRELQEKLFRPYTIKQWNREPRDLAAEVLARIPVRTSADPRQFADRQQALPVGGYTSVIRRMLSHTRIQVFLESCFLEWREREPSAIDEFDHIFFTGPIDAQFAWKQGALEYRSIDFHIRRHQNIPYFQPNSVVNYPSMDVPQTRIVEQKHFLNQSSPHSVTVAETTSSRGEPQYPVLTERNMELQERYRGLAEEAEQEGRVTFVGRLANQKQFNMDEAIGNALDVFDKWNLMREPGV